jgi:outer membrane protein TolC
MGLDGEADRQAKNAGRHKPILDKTPDGYQAEAYGDSGRIAAAENHLAVGKQDANKQKGDFWRISCANIPHKKGGKDEKYGCDRHPQQ